MLARLSSVRNCSLKAAPVTSNTRISAISIAIAGGTRSRSRAINERSPGADRGGDFAHRMCAKVMIASSVICGPISSPVITPSLMTRVRSHMPMISFSSELIIRMP